MKIGTLKLFAMVMMAAMAAVFVACKDDFTEEDYLRLQDELALKEDSIKRARDNAFLDAANLEQAQALVDATNQAGELMAVSVLVRENGSPVSGVTVTLTSGTPDGSVGGRTSSTAAAVTATTDASGVADFPKATIGPSTITFSATGYVKSSARVDFGTVGTPTAVSTTINGVTKTTYAPPQKRNVAITVPLFSKTANSTATVKGKFRIQTDLTNNTVEVPQNITVAADFSALVSSTSTTSDLGISGTAATITAYRFDDGGFGTATVDNTTGEYSMIVPASTSGYALSLIVPTIEASQTIAVNKVEGVLLAAPEYRTTTAIFGPNAGGYGAIPTIPGAVAVFPTPAAPGAGLNFTFTAKPRSLGTWNSTSDNVTLPFTQGNVVYQLTSRGTTVSASPIITVAGNGTGAQMKASLQGVFSGATVANGGAGYVNDENVTVTFNFKDNTSPTPVSRLITSYTAQVKATGGVITSIAAPSSPVSWVTSNKTNGFDVTSFEVVISGGSGTTTATATPIFTSELEHLQMTSGGSNYTTVTGVTVGTGGATIAVKEVKNQWIISAPTKTTAYPVLPTAVKLAWTSLLGNPAMSDGTTDITDQNDNTASLLGALRVSAGDVVFADPTKTWRTTAFSASAPSVVETTNPAVKAKADVVINAAGQVTGLTTTGANFNAGDGYNSPLTVAITPTIATAPGTGAVIQLTGITFDQARGEYTWPTAFTHTALNGGSGYLANLNQYNTTGTANAVSGPTVKSGQTYVVDYDYNAGFRKVNFN